MSDIHLKQYYTSLEAKHGGEAYIDAHRDEFPASLDTEAVTLSRRSFLAAAGFSMAGAALFSGCQRAPEEKAIPLLVRPEEMTPGRAIHFATTCGGCSAQCGVLAKSRDGRPIKLEGNPAHPLSRGGLCAVGQATVLDLYDNQRLTQPTQRGQETTWETVDSAIIAKLDEVRATGGNVRVLTRSISSPTLKRVIQKFTSSIPNSKHVVLESQSCSAILDAHEKTHGVRVLPTYRFEDAKVIASFGADFLGSWISPIEYTAGWSSGRKISLEDPEFTYHAQFEARLSMTGSKADKRIISHPSEIDQHLVTLAALIAEHAGEHFEHDTANAGEHNTLSDLADRLWHARGHSLVVSDSQDVQIQVLCNYINHLLDNYGHTLDIIAYSNQKQDNDAAFATFMDELDNGQIDVLIMHGVNPVFELPNAAAFTDSLSKMQMVISCSARLDETSTHATYVCPDHHYLESWGDAEPVKGVFTFRQPIISPLGKTRAFMESIAKWGGKPRQSLQLLRETWPSQSVWDNALHDGVHLTSLDSHSQPKFMKSAISAVENTEHSTEDIALVLYSKVSMLDSYNAGNPWLHELPDPISKVAWDNYASIAVETAASMGLETGDVVSVQLQGDSHTSIDLPVLVQPGQHEKSIAIALNYGAEISGRFGTVGPQWFEGKPSVGKNGLVGTNAAILISDSAHHFKYSGAAVTITKTHEQHSLACTQEYHYITVPEHLAIKGHERRDMVQETTAEAIADGHEQHHAGHHSLGELWADDHRYEGHHWGMVIDLTTCTGCSACVIGCQAENNIPVVGKDEIARNRDMFWMRIDRYYADGADGLEVSHQPMMCHHCDNAPCETVCPVLATVHSDEGLNQQVYNRCVGTRYCANNCPYKVRRFNWFNYKHDDKLANMVLNPDISVRTRGVMEKCSFCVQRIHEAKAEATRLGQPLADGDIQPACQQSCPSQAIVFGDMNDPDSAVSKLINSGRHYRVLEEINVKPSVGYLNLVRNHNTEKDHNGHG